MAAYNNQQKYKELEETKTVPKREIDLEVEKEFVKLFDEVLQNNRNNVSDKEIGSASESLVELFKRTGISGSCVAENLASEASVCAYFYRLGPLLAAVTRDRIITALRECKELRSCFDLDSVKIVDVGSGAGCGLVGLFSALGIRENYKGLEVTALDYNSEYEKFFNDIVEKLRKESFGNASRLLQDKGKNIECSFLCNDLFQSNHIEQKKKLNEADIIIVKGFLSILKTNDQRREACKIIVAAMKLKSLLVIIESPSYLQYVPEEQLRRVFDTKGRDDYQFQAHELSYYGNGFARQSNQQIYVFEKKKISV